jgi:hypothetical protein
MEQLIELLTDFLKKFSPYIIGGAIGSVIHRMRTEMTFVTFLKSVVMSIFISICVGIVCKDYLNIVNENIIFVFCGISGTFSKIILDELEQIVKLGFSHAKNKIKKQE